MHSKMSDLEAQCYLNDVTFRIVWPRVVDASIDMSMFDNNIIEHIIEDLKK